MPPTERPSAHARRWAPAVSIAAASLVLRLLLIYLYPHVRDDLAIYSYFGAILADGGNPYAAPIDGPIHHAYADMPILDMALFAAVLSIWETPLALRVVFAFFDILVVLTLGLVVQRPQKWRLNAMLFWGFNPMVLLSYVIFTVDKSIVVWLLLLTVTAVEAGRPHRSLLWTTLLTLYRWIGVFFVAPLILHSYRTWRARAGAAFIFAAVLLISHIPFFPANLKVYAGKSARTQIDPPIHASPSRILAELGLYEPWMVTVGIAVVVLALYALYLWRKMSLVEVIVLSAFVPVLLAPEMPVGRMLMVGLPVLLLVTMNAWRWGVLWVTSLIGAPFANGYETDAILGFFNIPSVIEYSSAPYVVLVNLVTAAFLGFYLVDKWRGLVATDTRLRPEWLAWPWQPRGGPPATGDSQHPAD